MHDRRPACSPATRREGPDSPSPGSRPRSRRARRSSTTISTQSGLQERSRRARLQPRRLRLHHLHRQFRPAAGGDLGGDQRQRPRRRRGALGQPQLRGPRQSGRAGELSRLAAARRRLCAGRLACRSTSPPSRSAWARTASPVYLQGHLADPARRSRARRRKRHQVAVQVEICRRVQGRRELAEDHRSTGGRPMPGTWRRPMCRTRLISSACTKAPERRSTDIVNARVLGLFLDSITTDHISPAGSIKAASPGRHI